MRVARPDAVPENAARLKAWLDAGHHGTMDWMSDTAPRRADPRTVWAEVRAVVMVGMNYGPNDDPRAVHAMPDRGAISVYARHRDYHDLMKGRLKLLADKVRSLSGHEGRAKVFVDTAPVMEKPLAMAAGLGWQGRHTNLVSREYGSWLLLGALFTTLDLVPDAPAPDSCGGCRACLDACPTDAFVAPNQLDARRCISYLTIEHAGPIPRAFRAKMGNRIYGCDDCLAVCPWNKFAQVAREAKLVARDDLRAPSLTVLAALDDAAFREKFSGSPIKRIGRDRFVRNVLTAIGNSREPTLLPVVRARLADASPLVRGAAVWALARLAPFEAMALSSPSLAREPDADVRAEWMFVAAGKAQAA